MNILVSNSSPDPIFSQIAKQLKALIISAELKPGDALPSIRKLASELQISVITTKRAYTELEKEGYIDTVGGKGCFVAMQNKSLLKEKRMKTIEEMLNQTVMEAKKLGVEKTELQEMITLLYDEVME